MRQPMQPTLFETEAGLILLDGENVLLSYSYRQMTRDADATAEWVASRAREQGIARVSVTTGPIGEALRRFGIETTRLSDEEVEKLNSRKLSLIVASGLAANEQEALEDLEAISAEGG